MGNQQDFPSRVDEIDLREQVEVLLRQKGIISSITGAAVFVAALWCLFTPKMYEVSMVFGPPRIIGEGSGAEDLDSVTNIKAKIDSGAFNNKISDDLSLREPQLRFDVSQPRDSKLIKVSLERPADKVATGKQILAKLLEGLQRDYESVIAVKKTFIDNQLHLALNRIESERAEIALQNEQLKNFSDREQQFIEELRATKDNSQRLLEDRKALLQRKTSSEDISSLLFSVTIQQNLSYFSQLQSDLLELKTKKEKALGEIDRLKSAINQDQVSIENLRLAKAGIYDIHIIQEPLASLQPVGPRKGQTLLMAAFLGIFLGILVALFREFWDRPKSSGPRTFKSSRPLMTTDIR